MSTGESWSGERMIRRAESLLDDESRTTSTFDVCPFRVTVDARKAILLPWEVVSSAIGLVRMRCFIAPGTRLPRMPRNGIGMLPLVGSPTSIFLNGDVCNPAHYPCGHWQGDACETVYGIVCSRQTCFVTCRTTRSRLARMGPIVIMHEMRK